ncbi:hypothetical protein FLL45_15745 [Aliikangiella marina]|uniref:Uncharacterized protein n=1 Tax=Aliikangiella marina TaxID=1712262 RepID=A0A545T6R1_9GAMM|nr:hypothetical protein [Aliikangiella marina]TQV72917.1 hypothetical protein FLL45_15745 [Aliikangiella marina]
MDTASAIDKTLNNLLRGLAHNSGETIYQSHRALFEIGESALPAIEKQLMSYKWNGNKVGIEISILTGLLGLIHDIDEKRVNKVGAKIREKGCSKIVDGRIDSILKFTLDEFNSFRIRNVDIYQSNELTDTKRIKRKMTKWLSSVPEEDLEEIERLYLIPEQNVDYRGTYMPILCSVMVEWDITTARLNPLSYFLLLRIEKTLYHEIGHHAYKHPLSEGEDPEKEKEADHYTAKLLVKNHPMLKRIIRIVRFLLGKRTNGNAE